MSLRKYVKSLALPLRTVYIWAAGVGLPTDVLSADDSDFLSDSWGVLILILVVLSLIPLVVKLIRQWFLTVRFGKLGLWVAIAISVFFVFGELTLRLVFLEGETFSAHGGPIVSRFERDFSFNRFDGPSRGPEPSSPARATERKILVQGDSITWGQGVRFESELYSSQLLTSLNESSLESSMAVLAYPGRNIDGHIQQLKKWGGELEPDIIIYQWYVNDIETDTTLRPRQKKFWQHIPLHRRLARHSYLWWFLDYSAQNLLSKPDQSYEDYLLAHFQEDSKGWQSFVQNFSVWASLANELTPDVIILLYPDFHLKAGKAPTLSSASWEFQERMMSLCETNNVVCIDMANWLLSLRDSSMIAASAYDGHPGPIAHQAIANGLYEELRHYWPGSNIEENLIAQEQPVSHSGEAYDTDHVSNE